MRGVDFLWRVCDPLHRKLGIRPHTRRPSGSLLWGLLSGGSATLFKEEFVEACGFALECAVGFEDVEKGCQSLARLLGVKASGS